MKGRSHNISVMEVSGGCNNHNPSRAAGWAGRRWAIKHNERLYELCIFVNFSASYIWFISCNVAMRARAEQADGRREECAGLLQSLVRSETRDPDKKPRAKDPRAICLQRNLARRPRAVTSDPSPARSAARRSGTGTRWINNKQ